LLPALMLVAAGAALAVDTSTQNVTITVTPVVNTVFTISPASISLGNVDINTSTGNVTELVLENTGDVTLTFEKTVMTMTNWTLGTPDKDVCRLQAAAQAAVPADWGVAVSSVTFDTTLTNYNDLTDGVAGDGIPISLDKDETENLWFNLDMPTGVTAAVQETITARIKGTSQ
ncbi:hypothetical protein ACFLUV_01360, partial [Elusimicrobiota bacterium]